MKIDKVLWAAMVFSTVIYAGMAYMVLRERPTSFEAALRQPYTLVLYGFALAAFVAGFILPRLMRAPGRLKMIIALAIFESCAIFGLMAAFLGHDWRLFIPAWIVALIGMMGVYPAGDSPENQYIPR